MRLQIINMKIIEVFDLWYCSEVLIHITKHLSTKLPLWAKGPSQGRTSFLFPYSPHFFATFLRLVFSSSDLPPPLPPLLCPSVLSYFFANMSLSYSSFLCAFLGTWIHTQYNFPKGVILYLGIKIFPPSTIKEQKPCWLPVLPCFWNSIAHFTSPAVGKAVISSSTRSICRLQKTVQVHIWKDAIHS